MVRLSSVITDKDFKPKVRIRTLNRRSRLTIPSMFISSMLEVKEPTYYSKRVGHEVSGVVSFVSG